VAWPSGAFVRVDRLDAEAIAGVERSADFAAAIGSPVLTIHLFTPMSPEEYRAQPSGPDDAAIEKFLRDHATGAVPEALYERYAADSIAHLRAALGAAV